MILVVFTFAKLVSPVLAVSCSAKKFFFIPPWWEYLQTGPDGVGGCKLITNGFSFNDLLAVGLGILDIMLRIAGFLAVASIIYAGINYMTTMGNAEKASSARHRIYDALIGLAFVFIATALVTFMGNSVATK